MPTMSRRSETGTLMAIDPTKERPHWLPREEAADYLRLGESTLSKAFHIWG